MNGNEILLVILIFFLVQAVISMEWLEENAENSLYPTLHQLTHQHTELYKTSHLTTSVILIVTLHSPHGKANPPRNEHKWSP